MFINSINKLTIEKRNELSLIWFGGFFLLDYYEISGVKFVVARIIVGKRQGKKV